MKPILVRITVVFSLLSCIGWGREGHHIVGEIASHDLTPEATRAVNELLDGKSLAEISTWADEIRPIQSYKWAEPLHYVNIDPSVKSFDFHRDCPTGECVVGAIYHYTAVLRDPASSKDEKAEALKFLVHFVEDIHQPLHVSPAGDRGGNDVKIEFFGEKGNLHAVWDTLIIEHTGKEWQQYADELRAKIAPAQRNRWKRQLDASQWATESYKLAISNAHAIPADHQLGDKYYRHNLPVVDKRLKMASVRLAAMLNAIFSDGKGLPTPPAVTSAPATAPGFQSQTSPVHVPVPVK